MQLRLAEYICGDVLMATRKTLMTKNWMGDKLNRESAAPEFTAKLSSIGP
jgi:hypothetical protein